MQDLTKVLDFTEDDLAANQAGYLSQRQYKSLYKRILFTDYVSLVVALIGGWIFGLAMYFVLAAISGGNSGLILLVTLFALTVITVLFGSPLLVNLIWLRRDMAGNRVQLLSGFIQLTYQWRNGYFLDCQDERFFVGQQIFSAFKDGAHYQLYYLPHSKRILAALEV